MSLLVWRGYGFFGVFATLVIAALLAQYAGLGAWSLVVAGVALGAFVFWLWKRQGDKVFGWTHHFMFIPLGAYPVALVGFGMFFLAGGSIL